MNKLLMTVLIGMMGLMFVPRISVAQTQDQVASGIINELTAEDKALLVELLRTTRGDSTTATTKQQKATPQISWEEIANKYLDQAFVTGSKLVTKAEEIFTKNAPQLWAVLIKQQMVVAITDIAAPLVFILFCVLWGAIWNRHTFSFSDIHAAFVWYGPGICSAVAAVYWCFSVSESIRMFVNPEFYAIKQIVLYMSQVF